MIHDGENVKDAKIASFLMAGQSNMAGRGKINEVEPIDNELCFMLRMGRWQPMREPVNTDRAVFGEGFVSGISLATSFADCYAKAEKCKTGLIPCADGGTRISQWMPGELLFDHAVMMTGLAMRTSELKGILWHQGESDCREFDKEEYKRRLVLVICEFRKQFGNEKLPFILGEISEDITEEWNVGKTPPVLNQALHEIAEEIPFCGVAGGKDLKLQKDGIHFSASSCREFGKRYYEVYRKIATRKL